MRKEREVQVPSQVAHSTPTPVLKHVQVHLSFELGVRRDVRCHTVRSTPPPCPDQPNRAYLFPPWGCLVGEVQWGWLLSSSRKQHVWALPLGLQERLVKSEF